MKELIKSTLYISLLSISVFSHSMLRKSMFTTNNKISTNTAYSIIPKFVSNMMRNTTTNKWQPSILHGTYFHPGCGHSDNDQILQHIPIRSQQPACSKILDSSQNPNSCFSLYINYKNSYLGFLQESKSSGSLVPLLRKFYHMFDVEHTALHEQYLQQFKVYDAKLQETLRHISFDGIHEFTKNYNNDLAIYKQYPCLQSYVNLCVSINNLEHSMQHHYMFQVQQIADTFCKKHNLPRLFIRTKETKQFVASYANKTIQISVPERLKTNSNPQHFLLQSPSSQMFTLLHELEHAKQDLMHNFTFPEKVKNKYANKAISLEQKRVPRLKDIISIDPSDIYFADYLGRETLEFDADFNAAHTIKCDFCLTIAADYRKNRNNAAGYFKAEDFEPLIQQAKANPCRCKAHSQDEQNREVTLLDVLPPAL